jgi:hypothetical protein
MMSGPELEDILFKGILNVTQTGWSSGVVEVSNPRLVTYCIDIKELNDVRVREGTQRMSTAAEGSHQIALRAVIPSQRLKFGGPEVFGKYVRFDTHPDWVFNPYLRDRPVVVQSVRCTDCVEGNSSA